MLPNDQDGVATGYRDRHGAMIYYGNLLRTGMRIGDPEGWTTDRVVRGDDGEPLLADPKTGERMGWATVRELRELV